MEDRIQKLKELAPTVDELVGLLSVETLQQIADRYTSLYPIVLAVKWREMNSFQRKVLRDTFNEEVLYCQYRDHCHPAMIEESRRLIEVARSLGFDRFLKVEFCSKGTVIQKHYTVPILDEDSTSGPFDASEYLIRQDSISREM